MKCLLTFLFLFSVHSVRYWNRKWFFKLFRPDWEGKTLLYAFSSILKSETVLLAFRLVREIGKWFLNFISVYFCKLGLETFDSRNSESEKKHSAPKLKMETNVLTKRFFFSFVDLALEMKTEINVLTECFFFSFINSALETKLKYSALKMETETFASGFRKSKHLM
ncbi:hypothetical protein C1645_745564 [Glomus cerebriforme]|uniref:Secreted protein n=1 Tax=Glomus cerebriforme TaxID=658196 RepID=A0A397S5I2_9GLOM|nr:hypothetical protein C1645_745564 [Glomus cerebriforme]